MYEEIKQKQGNLRPYHVWSGSEPQWHTQQNQTKREKIVKLVISNVLSIL